MKKTGWLVLQMVKSFDTTAGTSINLEVGNHLGACMVFKTKEAAQQIWGNDVRLVEIQYAEDN